MLWYNKICNNDRSFVEMSHDRHVAMFSPSSHKMKCEKENPAAEDSDYKTTDSNTSQHTHTVISPLFLCHKWPIFNRCNRSHHAFSWLCIHFIRHAVRTDSVSAGNSYLWSTSNPVFQLREERSWGCRRGSKEDTAKNDEMLIVSEAVEFSFTDQSIAVAAVAQDLLDVKHHWG